MNYYFDIQVLPDPEFPQSTLMNALFAKLHRALVVLDRHVIAISFPAADSGKTRNLGAVMRLHGRCDGLVELENMVWRKGLGEYTQVSQIKAIPVVTEYRVIKRMQSKSNAERLRRRMIKRHALERQQASTLIPDTAEKKLSQPFLTLNSSSTGQQFPLFIDQSTSYAHPRSGTFSKYGLSQNATIPWF